MNSFFSYPLLRKFKKWEIPKCDEGFRKSLWNLMWKFLMLHIREIRRAVEQAELTLETIRILTRQQLKMYNWHGWTRSSQFWHWGTQNLNEVSFQIIVWHETLNGLFSFTKIDPSFNKQERKFPYFLHKHTVFLEITKRLRLYFSSLSNICKMKSFEETTFRCTASNLCHLSPQI